VPVPFFRGQAWSAPLSPRPPQNRRRRKTGTGSRPTRHARQPGQPMRAGCLSPFSVGKPGQHLFRQGQHGTNDGGKRGLAHGPLRLIDHLNRATRAGCLSPFSVGKPGQHLFRQGQHGTNDGGKRGLAHGPLRLLDDLNRATRAGCLSPFSVGKPNPCSHTQRHRHRSRSRRCARLSARGSQADRRARAGIGRVDLNRTRPSVAPAGSTRRSGSCLRATSVRLQEPRRHSGRDRGLECRHSRLDCQRNQLQTRRRSRRCE
jgi:hypothetical protein